MSHPIASTRLARALTLTLAVAAVLGLARPANAALDIGEKAPDFNAPAALAGSQFAFKLSEALAKGPVVLYFYPAAFSVGCSAEAHEFAESIDKFEALGATVVGVSSDDIDTQLKFSRQVCQGRFAVAADATHQVIKAYDAAMMVLPDYANRVTYLIAPDKSIVYTYQSLNPSKHVQNALNALREWKNAKASK